MEALSWIGERWFDLLQTVGIIGGLLFTAHSVREDHRARRIGNSIAISDQYRQIWKELFEYPKLFRALSQAVDLKNEPVSAEEELFVNLLIQHLGTVFRAMKHGEFVKLEGLQKDVEEFFSLPIPRAVWNKIKGLQDVDFVKFVEVSQHGQ